ncbi:uncharacterized protein LOC134534481 [Bacillus rossius redtenbacheri]|uniref:uncharacterized protein LOC134534481 n=1 Tax=Bacillus rossius redtenbacheri TaxID=93214 RepID=UPI002FDE10C1
MAAAHLLVAAAACLSLLGLQGEGKFMDPETALDRIDPELKAHIKACEQEQNVSIKHCHDEFKKKQYDVIPEDCKCFAYCVAKKAEVTDQDGKIIPLKLKQKIDDIKDEKYKHCAQKLYEDCKTAPRGEGGCSDTNNLVICFALHARAHQDCRFE